MKYLRLLTIALLTLWASGQAASRAALSVPSGNVSFLLELNEESNSDVTLSGVPAGFDVSNQTYLGWCVDMDTDVVLNAALNGRLFDVQAVPEYLSGIDWNRILYILNHKQGGRGDVQLAIWFFTDQNADLPPHAMAMVQAALDHGANFTPGPGQIGGVVVVPDRLDVQEMIIEVPVPNTPPTEEPCIPPQGVEYWKGKSLDIHQILAVGPIDLGDVRITTALQALTVLYQSNSSDVRAQLRAQLLVAILNIKSGVSATVCGENVQSVIDQAIQFLTQHKSAGSLTNAQKEVAKMLKDLLLAFNSCEPDCAPGGGTTGGGTGGTTGSTTGGGTGGTTGSTTGGTTGGNPPQAACPFTIGYWKNHDAHLAQVLAKGAINLGDRTIRTGAEALAVLNAANATDARDMLRAQLLGTLLNLQNGSSPMNTGSDIRVVASQAVQFLATHSSPVKGEHPDRAQAISLKDRLDAYNNSKGDDCGGLKPPKGRDDGGDDKDKGKSTDHSDKGTSSNDRNCKGDCGGKCEKHSKYSKSGKR